MKSYKQQIAIAAERMDWGQVVANGGPPCFHLEKSGKFCGRAESWVGHNSHHTFVSFAKLITDVTENEAAKSFQLPALDDDLKEILGLMLWTTGAIGRRLNELQLYKVERRVEAEQATTLHWLLNLYLLHGPEWKKKAADVL